MLRGITLRGVTLLLTQTPASQAHGDEAVRAATRHAEQRAATACAARARAVTAAIHRRPFLSRLVLTTSRINHACKQARNAALAADAALATERREQPEARRVAMQEQARARAAAGRRAAVASAASKEAMAAAEGEAESRRRWLGAWGRATPERRREFGRRRRRRPSTRVP